jgi:ribonuclease HII
MSSTSIPLTYETKVWKENPSFLVCGIDEAGRGPLAGPVVAAACIMLPPAAPATNLEAPVNGVNDSKTVDEEDREQIFDELMKSQSLCFGVSVVDHRVIDRINVLQATMLAMTRAFAAAKEEANRRITTKSKASEVKDVHTVYIDGPLCPFRLAAATTGEVDPDEQDEVKADASQPLGPPDFGAEKVELLNSLIDGGFASILAENQSLSSSSSSPKKKALPKMTTSSQKKQDLALTTSLSMYSRGLQSRLGKITSLIPVIKGDSKVFCIAAASIIAKVTRDRIMRKAEDLWPGYGFAEHKGYGTASHMAAIRGKGASPIHRLTFAPMKNMYPEKAEEARGAPLQAPATKSSSKGDNKSKKRKRV